MGDRRFLLLPLLLLAMAATPTVLAGCSSDRLVLYQVTMETHWSKEDFPKDYPKFRPPAQFSKLIGRTHDAEFSLFRIGSFASPGFKKFAETGNSELIDNYSTPLILDGFTAPPITQGVGQTEAQFFADGNHSRVSLSSRIVPSPDWFVGVDSIELCPRNQDEWVQTLTIEVDPVDAGSDNGLTFTSPKWASVPQEAIYQITAHNPSHPASSFHYPDKTRHRPLATFTLLKLKEYSLWPHVTEGGPPEPLTHLLDDGDTNDLGNELSPIAEAPEPEEPLVRANKRKRSRKLKGRDCVVSQWGAWSDCTSKTCDLSEQYRTRSVVSHPRGNGQPCPALTEKRTCLPDKACQESYFDW